jgi:hypothetical protein
VIERLYGADWISGAPSERKRDRLTLSAEISHERQNARFEDQAGDLYCVSRFLSRGAAKSRKARNFIGKERLGV